MTTTELAVQPKPRVELVTPKRAAHYLTLNTRNRRSSPSVVHKYAEDMRLCRWTMTTDAIGFFASDGALQNRQQRLAAIVESGIPQWLVIIDGLSDDSTNGQDMGKRRSAADLLFLANPNGDNGLKADRSTAAAYRYIIYLRQMWQGSMSSFKDSRKQPTMNDIVELAMAENIYFVYDIGRRLSRSTAPIMRSVALALAYEFAAATSYEKMEEFFTGVIEGASLEAGSPILRLRTMLIRNSQSKAKKDEMILAANVIKAFNFWLHGAKIQQLGWRSEGAQDEAFPQIGAKPVGDVARRMRQAS